MTKFVALLSGKGGVGKTTSTLNLGVALRTYGRDVIILDANISMPNLGLHLGSTNLNVYLNHVLKNENSIIDSVYRHPSGLKIIPASIHFQDIEGSSLLNLKDKISELKNKAEVVLLDCAAGIGDEVLHVLKAADEAIIVTNPDLVSVTDALRTIHFSEENGVTVLGILVNKIRGDEFELSVDNIETILNKPVISEIPYDDNVRASLKAKHPVVFAYPDSKASEKYKKLAARLIGTVYGEPSTYEEIIKPTFFEKIMQVLGLK